MESIDELLKQRQEIDREIEKWRVARRVEALGKIAALMKESGLTTSDLVKADRLARSRADAVDGRRPPPRFRDPETGAMWSGLGRKPRWVAKVMASGRKMTDFAIAADQVAGEQNG